MIHSGLCMQLEREWLLLAGASFLGASPLAAFATGTWMSCLATPDKRSVSPYRQTSLIHADVHTPDLKTDCKPLKIR